VTGGAVLILGGTADARALADALHAAGVPVVTSLAGRVSAPRLPAGEVRTGGFGGADGLARWLAERRIAAVVDATHPFAARIATSAQRGCALAGVPLLRLERSGWQERPGDRWLRVPDVEAAAAAIEPGARVLLALGRQHLAPFVRRDDTWFLVRSIERPPPPLPPHHQLLLDRGPFTLESELAAMERHHIDLVVTRDSGGTATVAKIDAARQRRVPVIMITRPARPHADVVHDAEAAVDWARARTSP